MENKFKNVHKLHFNAVSEHENQPNKFRNIHRLHFNGIPKPVVTNFMDKVPFTLHKVYDIKIGNIYDASKLWIVTKYKELEAFQQSLFNYYDKHHKTEILRAEELKKDMDLIVFTDNGYHRATFIKIINVSCVIQAQVFLVDSGFVAEVGLENLYKIKEKMRQVVHFAVRACIFNVKPDNCDMWNSQSVTRLYELVGGKVVFMKVAAIDDRNKCLYVTISFKENNVCKDVGKVLIEEKFAISINEKQNVRQHSKYKRKVNDLFLFPSHKAIESGISPKTVIIAEKLKESVPWDILYRDLYIYKDKL